MLKAWKHPHPTVTAAAPHWCTHAAPLPTTFPATLQASAQTNSTDRSWWFSVSAIAASGLSVWSLAYRCINKCSCCFSLAISFADWANPARTQINTPPTRGNFCIVFKGWESWLCASAVFMLLCLSEVGQFWGFWTRFLSENVPFVKACKDRSDGQEPLRHGQ